MIIRRKHTSNYTTVSNALLIDTRISVEARWCMAYLLSKPENWELRASDLMLVASWGRDKTYNVIRELIDAGWIRRRIVHEGGLLNGVEYVVTDQLPENQEVDAGRQFPENQHTENQEPTKERKRLKTEHKQDARAKPPRKTGSRVPEDFAPDHTAVAIATGLGLHSELANITHSFIDHWTASARPDALKLDWQAAFRTWLRNEVKFNRRPHHGQPAHPTTYGSQRAEPPGSNLKRIFANIDAAIDAHFGPGPDGEGEAGGGTHPPRISTG